MLRLVNITRNSKGFSLVEVIIAMVIGLVGAMGSYALLASMHGTRAENMEVLQAQQEARNIMERVTRELRESSPEVVWPEWSEWEEWGDSEWVYFFTPRNANREFMVDPEGEPAWRRAVSYWLDSWDNTLYREQYYLTGEPDVDEYYGPEVVSKNVEYISFRRVNDMITINIRTFADNDGGIGQAARSHSELTTTIQLRN
ncbi:PilW family protein [Candidatus Poribacteria bacterium]